MIRLRAGRNLVPVFSLLCAWTLLALFQPPCVALALDTRDKNESIPTNDTIPTAVSVAPDQGWYGLDGKWNTFTLRVGTPEQHVRVLASTASQQIWVVFAEACWSEADNDLDRTCFDSRGRTFNTTKSETWHEKGFFQLWLEKNLQLLGNGLYGFDSVGLGIPGEEGPTIKNATVGNIITPNFWLGHLGLHAKSTNFTEGEPPIPSYMTYLFEQKYIPSMTFGYTAGARYHDGMFLGSLTLGGYDASRFERSNDLSFTFSPDNERDIVVGVVGISANDATRENVNLLTRESYTMFIDSTVAELYLPIEVCEAFEDAFGLKYDNDTHLYLVDDLLHETLKAQNPTITFSLGQKYVTDVTVDVSLPYSAFDLEASAGYRGLENDSRYFPIRRGEKEDQWVLGRTFLQEAYLIVDWERQNFSVFPCNWTYGESKDIVEIISPVYTGESLDPPKSKPLSTGAIIGIAIGCGFALALALFGMAWWFWRRKQKRKLEAVKAEYAAKAADAAARKDSPSEKGDELPGSPINDTEGATNVFPKAELPAEGFYKQELDSDVKDPSTNDEELPSPTVEADNTERQIFEMPGDFPTRQEADGRQLSEKESMMVRERIYNGVDPNSAASPTPSSAETRQRPEPLSPSEVQVVNRRLPNVSPVTPRMPRTPRDGAFLESSDSFFQPPSSRYARDARSIETDDTPLSPISPLEASTDSSRRRFSYET